MSYVLLVLVAFIFAYVTTDTRKWLDKESKFFLSSIYLAAAICAGLMIVVPAEYKAPLVTLTAATLAAIGWVITNWQNRRHNLLQYTNTQIDQYRNDTEIQRCVLIIKEKFLNKTPIENQDLDGLWEDYLEAANYKPQSKEAPTLHHIVHILNFFERIAYLYTHDLVDKRLFYRHFNIILGKQVIRLQNVVRRIRSADGGKKSYNDLRLLLIEWYGFDIDQTIQLNDEVVTKRRLEHFYER